MNADLKKVAIDALKALDEVLGDLEVGDILNYQRRNRLKLEAVKVALETIRDGSPK